MGVRPYCLRRTRFCPPHGSACRSAAEAVLIILAGFQVYYLRGYFENKQIV